MRSCCATRPRIIKVGGLEVGLTGLDDVLRQVYLTMAEADEGSLAEALLQGVKANNYVTPGREEAYQQALLREYRRFVAQVEQGKRMP